MGVFFNLGGRWFRKNKFSLLVGWLGNVWWFKRKNVWILNVVNFIGRRIRFLGRRRERNVY